MRIFVRNPAGLPAYSRSMPMAPPRRVASRSLARTLSRSASATASSVVGAVLAVVAAACRRIGSVLEVVRR
jgi:hypothetical protein